MEKNLKYYLGALLFIGFTWVGSSQAEGLVGNLNSPYSKLHSLALDDVRWTDGFWQTQFEIEKENTLPFMWDLYHDAEVTHAYRNFEIAAGLLKGTHDGPSFHDGDFYKIMEAMASVYATTKDKKLDKQMDQAIAMIAKTQRKDGYIHTPVLIEERWGTLGEEELKKQLGFEKYNMGHLMTAASVHYRATGKDNFLEIAIGVADYLYDFYQKASPDLARNAICPSHYMGVVEMYRSTGDQKYLELANHLIDIRGTTQDGTDDNQDRIPFRQQTTAMGHAVRANYLYAGVADLYAETGEQKLLQNLESIWEDVVYRKMYITGGCGSLYDGVSPDGTSYDPSEVQKIHQAYGRPFQLPNATAHTETCANIGNVLWNWRMLQVTGKAKYADVLELALYNSVLSGMNLEGNKFLYNNPLNVSQDLPFEQRWGNERLGYIALSNCCPPNVTRTLAQINNYAYSLSDDGLYVNLYGSNELETETAKGKMIKLHQESNYPWEGNVRITIDKATKDPLAIFLRIPGWSKESSVLVNGQPISKQGNPGTYLQIERTWNKGDVITLQMPMPVELMQANPLVEATKNQVTVKRGPLVYCLESESLPENVSINEVILDVDSSFALQPLSIQGRELTAIKARVTVNDTSGWNNQLYRPITEVAAKSYQVNLIPYFAWGNRDTKEMSVWLSY